MWLAFLLLLLRRRRSINSHCHEVCFFYAATLNQNEFFVRWYESGLKNFCAENVRCALISHWGQMLKNLLWKISIMKMVVTAKKNADRLRIESQSSFVFAQSRHVATFVYKLIKTLLSCERATNGELQWGKTESKEWKRKRLTQNSINKRHTHTHAHVHRWQ